MTLYIANDTIIPIEIPAMISGKGCPTCSFNFFSVADTTELFNILAWFPTVCRIPRASYMTTRDNITDKKKCDELKLFFNPIDSVMAVINAE